MWKQQDSLEAPTAAEEETPGPPQAGGGSEENQLEPNPLLERLRALEVNSFPQITGVSVIGRNLN